MPLPYFTIAIPVQQGSVGAAVNISANLPVLTVLNFLTDPNGVVQLEQSFDGTFYTPVAGGQFAGGPSTAIVEAEANWIRCRRTQGTGVAGQVLHAADQSSVGAPGHVGPLNVPAAGVGAVGDISGEPPNLVVTFNGAIPTDQVTVEHSFDGTNYAPLGIVFSGQSQALVSGANDLRGNRTISGLAAGTLDVWGGPK